MKPTCRCWFKDRRKERRRSTDIDLSERPLQSISRYINTTLQKGRITIWEKTWLACPACGEKAEEK